MNKITPLKKFGQNFLRDQNIINKIIEELSPKEEEIIFEIGPGQGALTEYLYKNVKNYYAIEIDKRAVELLKNIYPGIKIINKDILKFNINEFTQSNCRFIGNIPYNITSPILFKLLENRNIVDDAVLMMQYEVAQRLVGKPKTKEYGILSVIFQKLSDVKFCFKVSPNVFYPKPKVNSAVIHISFNKRELNINEELFIKVVKSCFGNRRKTLKNSLSNSIFADKIKNINGFDFSKRAEELNLEEFETLTKLIEELSDE